jgi:DNA-binding transcriptional regulator of glucitol operon
MIARGATRGAIVEVRRYRGPVRAFVTPRWLIRHALLLLSLAVLGRIGWWFETARAEDDWQNYGYALQWWLFGGFAVFLWAKLVLDELDPARVEPAPEVTSELPAVARQQEPVEAVEADGDGSDPELAAYNRHLAWLAENGRR